MNHTSQLADAGTRVAADFRTLATHAEELLKATKAATGDTVETARKQLSESLSQARSSFSSMETDLLARGREAVAATSTYARAHPWQMVAAAVAVGLLIALIARGDHGESAERDEKADKTH